MRGLAPAAENAVVARRYALVLGGLALAFLARVLGQALVAFLSVGFLPPMQEWYSGLIPYPILLPIQIAILCLQAWISSDLWRGAGWFYVPRPRAAGWIRGFAAVYFAVMVARLLLTEGGRIPIFFHWLLALYLWILARCFARSDAKGGQAP